jgi:predicted glycosyltransferase
MAERGITVVIISGGIDKPQVVHKNLILKLLPGIKTDSAFNGLYDSKGNPVTAALKQKRTHLIIQILKQTNPGFVLIETFPFGRRQMRFELLPLLEYCRTKLPVSPQIACSIRDIIQPKDNPEKNDEIITQIDRYFDHILVHGDQNIIAFDETFPQCYRFSEKISYTGYVSVNRPSKTIRPINSQTIIVSAGGGAVGEALYTTAIKAAISMEKNGDNRFRWHILVGNNIPKNTFEKLIRFQTPTIKIEFNRTDFFELLEQAALSISQAGYNTAMDILNAGVKSIVVPFEGVGEREQLIRARLLENLGLVRLVREKSLSPETLIKNIDRISADCKQGYLSNINLNGATNTAKLAFKYL